MNLTVVSKTFKISDCFCFRYKREIHNCLSTARVLREDEARLDREASEKEELAERLEREARMLDEEADRLQREAGPSSKW